MSSFLQAGVGVLQRSESSVLDFYFDRRHSPSTLDGYDIARHALCHIPKLPVLLEVVPMPIYQYYSVSMFSGHSIQRTPGLDSTTAFYASQRKRKERRILISQCIDESTVVVVRCVRHSEHMSKTRLCPKTVTG